MHALLQQFNRPVLLKNLHSTAFGVVNKLVTICSAAATGIEGGRCSHHGKEEGQPAGLQPTDHAELCRQAGQQEAADAQR